MAVNINCFPELLTPNAWKFVGDIVGNEQHKYDPEAPPMAPQPIFESFHKELAAILVDTKRPIRSTTSYDAVVPRRGQPVDLSTTLREHFAYYTYDDAMFYSWFTTKELIDFDMGARFMIRQAYVDSDVAHLFDGCPIGFPFSSWPTDKPIQYAEWSREGVKVTWREPYASIVREFADVFPAALLEIGDAEHTRLIVQAGW